MPDLENVRNSMAKVQAEMGRILMGQDAALEQLATCLLAGGHVILEGVPGLGKTLLAKSLAKLVDAQFRRIQFTPDLLPSDIIGTNIFNVQTSKFLLYKGPIFTEILLADEINRTPPKTQAALTRSNGREAGYIRRCQKPAAGFILCYCHTESGGVRRDLSSAGNTTRQIHDEDCAGLSIARS